MIYLILTGNALKLLQFTELPLAGYEVTFRPVPLFLFDFARCIIDNHPLKGHYYLCWLIV